MNQGLRLTLVCVSQFGSLGGRTQRGTKLACGETLTPIALASPPPIPFGAFSPLAARGHARRRPSPNSPPLSSFLCHTPALATGGSRDVRGSPRWLAARSRAEPRDLVAHVQLVHGAMRLQGGRRWWWREDPGKLREAPPAYYLA